MSTRQVQTIPGVSPGSGSPSLEGVAPQIAQAARRLFATKGYDATSVREIVTAAGVTKPTLYYHFGSKAELAQTLLFTPLNHLLETLRDLTVEPGDPEELLARMVNAHLAFCRDSPDCLRFVHAIFFGPLGSSMAAEMTRVGDEIDRLLTTGIDRLVRAGRVSAPRAPALCAALRGLIVIHTADFLYRGGTLAPDLGRRIVADLLRGFGESGTSPSLRSP